MTADVIASNHEGDSYYFTCPGCDFPHEIVTRRRSVGGPEWEFNGSLVSPTFTPSLLVRWSHGPDHVLRVCHSYITDGKIRFLSDCTHALAGQEVPLRPRLKGNAAASTG